MAQPNVETIRISIASTDFQQMCSFAAISNIRSPEESLRELIVHTILAFEGDSLCSANDVAGVLSTMFGIDAPNHQIQDALDRLIQDGRIHKPLGTNYVLTDESRMNVQARIEQALCLQKRIRGEWMMEIFKKYVDFPIDAAWNALQTYLAKAFLRHGIQAVAFLDSSVELPEEYSKSLSLMLNDAVKSHFDSKHWPTAKEAIVEFLSAAGNKPDRTQYIAECADGAFSYFSLMVSPDVANNYRENLSPLVIFCDTNFLFGILDIHVNPQVEVSHNLLKVISDNQLPFCLKYHERTLEEAVDTINYYAGELKKNHWPQSLSRAAMKSPYISGIALKYHQKNVETGIDVDSFLRPYQHIHLLLKGKGIDEYKPLEDRLIERGTLQENYIKFLESIYKKKPDGSIIHDVAVLDCVRSIRKSTKSTINAGALLLTCDYTLYRFDSNESRRSKSYGSVVLPNVLWQILRPFIPASQDFDKSFAETFAIPEFRTIGSGAVKACSKMLNLLACYKDFPEETAAKLLSNDLLIDRLRAVDNDEQFQELVDSAISAENQTLIEERAALAKQIDLLTTDKGRVEKDLEQQKQESSIEIAKAYELLNAKKKEAEELTIAKDNAQEKARTAELKALRIRQFSSIIIALFTSLIFLVVINSVWRWDWLLLHPNSYGLQGCLSFMASFGIVGLCVKPWRKSLWGVGAFGILFVILQILGGPAKTP
jgi:hypothetical protein